MSKSKEEILESKLREIGVIANDETVGGEIDKEALSSIYAAMDEYRDQGLQQIVQYIARMSRIEIGELIDGELSSEEIVELFKKSTP